jgi:hypothetical protein
MKLGIKNLYIKIKKNFLLGTTTGYIISNYYFYLIVKFWLIKYNIRPVVISEGFNLLSMVYLVILNYLTGILIISFIRVFITNPGIIDFGHLLIGEYSKENIKENIKDLLSKRLTVETSNISILKTNKLNKSLILEDNCIDWSNASFGSFLLNF